MPPPVSVSDPCGTGALTARGAALVHRDPYLQDVKTRSATIVWAGMAEPAKHVVLAREDDEERTIITRVAGAHPAPDVIARARRAELYDELAEEDEPLEAEDYYLLAARLTGLEPDTHYCYRLESAGAPVTEWASLRTAPPRETSRSLRFAVIGDSGSGSAAQLAIARRLASLELDAMLFVGDIAYPSGSHEELQARFFDVYAESLRRTPVFPAIGNHEHRSNGGEPFEDVFVLPGNERWYSFDWGDVHFVVLDTNRIGTAQATWLDRDLAATKSRFKVVLGHHPPVTSAWRGPSREYLRWFVPILERHQVELVLSGHEHHYERSKPIRGVTYVVTGGGGADLYVARANWHTLRSKAVHHFVLLEVEDDEMTVIATDIEGRRFDRFTIK